jgi:hypothetical protein
VSRSLVLERAPYEGLFEVCREFLDESVPDDRFDGYGAEQAQGEGKERLSGERRAGSAVGWVGSGGRGDDFAHALEEGGGIELGAEDFVRAVGHDGDAPVADEGDKLFWFRGLDLGAKMLGLRNAGLALDIDKNEIVMAAPEDGQSFGLAEGGVDVKA